MEHHWHWMWPRGRGGISEIFWEEFLHELRTRNFSRSSIRTLWNSVSWHPSNHLHFHCHYRSSPGPRESLIWQLLPIFGWESSVVNWERYCENLCCLSKILCFWSGSLANRRKICIRPEVIIKQQYALIAFLHSISSAFSLSLSLGKKIKF